MTLLSLYQELLQLNQKALGILDGGADLEALEPLFLRKAELSALLASQSLPEAPEERQALIEVQQVAALSESNLVKALHPFVASNETKSAFRPRNASERPGKGFDFLG